MGWFWNTPPQSKPSTPPPAQAPSSSSSSQQQQSSPETDPEIQKFLSFFQDESKLSPESAYESQSQQHQQPSTPSSETSAAAAASSKSSWLSWRSSPSPAHNDTAAAAPTSTQQTRAAAQPKQPTPADALRDSLLPTDMSCRQAFDLAWGCQSPVGQWNAIYRYGTVKSCTEQWDDFWFCMRTKSFGKEAKETAIRNHYREKEQRKYGPGLPSSEDVWQSRDRLVEKGSVFNVTLEDDDGISDAELSLAQMQRRKMVQQSLAMANSPKQT